MRRLLRWGKNPFTAISPHANNPGPNPVIVWRPKGGGGEITPPPGPVLFLEDTFTGVNDVDLDDHTSDSGHSWVEHPDSQTNKDAELDGEGHLRPDNILLGRSLHYAVVTPPSVDYLVEAEIFYSGLADGNRGYVLIMARMDEAAYTYYGADIYRPTRNGDTSFRVSRIAAGANFELLGEVIFTPLATHTIRLEVDGSNIRGYLDGVLEVDVTDTVITDAGRPGVGVGYAQDGERFTFLVDRLTAGSFPVSDDPEWALYAGSPERNSQVSTNRPPEESESNPANVFSGPDLNYYAFWRSHSILSEPEQWLQWDFGEVKKIGQFRLLSRADRDKLAVVHIDVSDDPAMISGVTHTEINVSADGYIAGDWSTWITWTPVAGRYLRITPVDRHYLHTTPRVHFREVEFQEQIN